ncbi:MAG: YraN family protein [Pirellulales bacterium]
MALPSWLWVWFRPLPLGLRGERHAARYLRRKGYKIVARGTRSRRGELDLVAVDGRTVVFVEVKTRRHAWDESPAVAVGDEKQRRIARAALIFLKRHGLLEHAARFDVVAIIWPKDVRRPTSVEHFVNAFEMPNGLGQFYS